MRSLAAVLIVLLLTPAQLPAQPTADVAGDALRLLMAQPALRGTAPTAAELDGRVVVVAFFASWCPPCDPEFRYLNALARDHGRRDLTIVAVNVFEDFGGLSSPAKLEAFLDRHDPGFYVVAGSDAVKQAYAGLDRIPSLFVFARDGRLAYHFRHAPGAKKTHVGEAELRAVVEPLL